MNTTHFDPPLGVDEEEQEDMLILGNLCFEQLVELRHRGAFSAVAQAFTACCTRCRNSVDKTVQGYLATWYKVRSYLISARDGKLIYVAGIGYYSRSSICGH